MAVGARYGFSAEDVKNLRRRWARRKLQNCGWESFEHFLIWCSQNGCQQGMKLCKYNESLPHSPSNSYFKFIKPEDRHDMSDSTSRFCVGCTRECPGQGTGCQDWKNWFVANWNNKISKNPKLHQSDARHVWQYEHPDLEREGLRFESTGGL